VLCGLNGSRTRLFFCGLNGSRTRLFVCGLKGSQTRLFFCAMTPIFHLALLSSLTVLGNALTQRLSLPCTLHAVTPLSPSVYQIALLPTSILPFQAGQYIEICFSPHESTEKQTFLPFSLASAPSDPYLALCIREQTDHPLMPSLRSLRIGEKLLLRGASGALLDRPRPAHPSIFLATGTGIAPFRSILRERLRREESLDNCHLFFGVRSEDDILYRDEWESLLHERFTPILSRPSDSWQGARGHLGDIVRHHAARFPWSTSDVYLCGQSAMIAEMKSFLLAQGVAPDAIHHERW
jgi:ferredoxin-NADP reductase